MTFEQMRAEAGNLAAWYAARARIELNRNPDARPFIYYQMGSFHLEAGSSGRQIGDIPRAEMVVQPEAFLQFIEYKPEVAVHLISVLIDEFITEKEIFGLMG